MVLLDFVEKSSPGDEIKFATKDYNQLARWTGLAKYHRCKCEKEREGNNHK